jgi:hypothetical protein
VRIRIAEKVSPNPQTTGPSATFNPNAARVPKKTTKASNARTMEPRVLLTDLLDI